MGERRSDASAATIGGMLACMAAVGCNSILGFDEGRPLPAVTPSGSGGANGGGGAHTTGGMGGGGAPQEPSWLWATELTGPDAVMIRDLSVEPAGLTVAVGDFESALHVEDFVSTTDDMDKNAFVMRLSSDGELDWAQAAGDTQYGQAAMAVCHTSTMTVQVAGVFQGSVDFGDLPLSTPAGTQKVFTVSFTTAGDPLIGTESQTGGTHDVYGLAPTGIGAIVLGGSFGTAFWIDGEDVATGTSERAGYVTRLPSTGTTNRFATGIGHESPGDTGDQGVYGLVSRPDGGIVVGGDTQAPLGATAELAHRGGRDAFVYELDGADGSFRHGLVFGSDGDDGTGRLTLDSDGNVIVTGYYTGEMTVGATVIQGSVDTDMFLAKFDASGTLLWAKGFPGVGEQYGQDVVTDSDGNIMAVGVNSGQVDFGGDSLVSQGDFDGVVASFDPDGNHRWSLGIGGQGADWIVTAGWHEIGRSLIVGGRFSGSIQLGSHTLTGEGAIDSFVAKLAVPAQ